MRVAVFGLGYVGTVTAACLASRGHEVIGVDVDSAKVDMIAGGRSPVIEPGLGPTGLGHRLLGARCEQRPNAQDALVGAQVSLVCVGTPSAPNGSTDCST